MTREKDCTLVFFRSLSLGLRDIGSDFKKREGTRNLCETRFRGTVNDSTGISVPPLISGPGRCTVPTRREGDRVSLTDP